MNCYCEIVFKTQVRVSHLVEKDVLAIGSVDGKLFEDSIRPARITHMQHHGAG